MENVFALSAKQSYQISRRHSNKLSDHEGLQMMYWYIYIERHNTSSNKNTNYT
ncbi:hypothetical protein HYPBUDRAFT_152961 [Hyphopichia burtonii NRRL Y-1933]|uniref:Uncharacterized protein n=1 Tax=Hyphopichia burtonii NRRL Y-1933 TaxID=984485 RepID=A0A1E4RIA0_9ASCO|nr:hypothetical protein HYPBUDRAFT_152961 [Hyphopichia burtonii NRRL Y-1933]ODV66983.1 hypothetical protein HYPBUDRAFT_152961 [Hyphopichia burtonii NRRL Y-1933]